MVSEVGTIISRLIIKDELNEIEKFNPGCNVEAHIHHFEEKATEIELPKKDWAKYLKKTLSVEAETELKVQENYEEMAIDYEWVKRTLLSLFSIKKSTIMPLLELLDIYQGENQSLRDFLSSVRIKAYKVLQQYKYEDRENYMVMAFINGLRNKRFARCLKQLNPGSLNEAYEMVKRNINDDAAEDKHIRIIQHAESEVHILKSKVERLTIEVESLKIQIKRLMKTTPQTRTSQGRRNNNTNEKPFQCFNCSEPGHFARDCPKTNLKCQACGKPGHISRYCRNKTARINRQIIMDDVTISSEPNDSEPDTDVVKVSDDSIPNDTINGNQFSKVHTRRRSGKSNPMETEINAWNCYVMGTGAKPKHAETIISENHTEKAANKPIVKCKVGGKDIPVLFDSGAETNVIDCEFLNKLSENNRNIKFLKREGRLKCANGTKMRIIGYAFVNMTIGLSQVSAKFTVVCDLFPKVIIGIRTMKKEAIDITPRKDCIVSNGVELPFLSKTICSGNY